jgi:hypothetical protein
MEICSPGVLALPSAGTLREPEKLAYARSRFDAGQVEGGGLELSMAMETLSTVIGTLRLFSMV